MSSGPIAGRGRARPPRAPGTGRIGFRDALGGVRSLSETRELVLHLASRQLRSTHRRSALGWSWPLILQLTQLSVLVFVFGRVLPLGVDDYPTFVFCGLVFWSWFRSGLDRASTAITDNTALVLEPRTPRAVLPLVAIAVTTFDVLIALPVLLVLVVFIEGVSVTWLMLPVLMLIQGVLMAGIGFFTSAAHVYVRDVSKIVATFLLMLFYMTPVFYPLDAVPEENRWLFDINPAAGLVEGYRSILLDGSPPSLFPLAAIAAAAVALVVAGWFVFRRLERGFADEL